MNDSESSPTEAQLCQLCGKIQPDVEPGYLRVFRQAGRGFGSEAMNFPCLCCEACFHEAGRIKALRFKVVVWMATWLFLTPCCLSPLGLLDVNGSKVVNALLIVPTLCIVAAGFVAGPLLLRGATRRRTEHLLGPEVDRLVRSRAGVRRWGIFTELLIVRELPSGEAITTLW